MNYWGPWSTFLKKSGGIIAGNLVVTGTFQVDGPTTLNNDTDINGQVVISHDDPVGALPHLKLRDISGAGAVNAIWFETSGGTFKGAIYGTNPTNVCILPGSGGYVDFPSDVLFPNPLWKVPNLTDALTARRMLMLHSIMFGM